MISFDCPHCGQRVHAKDKYTGIEIHCPKCKQLIRIPNATQIKDEKPVTAPQTAESNIIRIRCPGCHQKIGLNKDLAGKTVVCAKCKKPMQVPSPGQHRAVFQPQAPDLLDHEVDFNALLSPEEAKTSPDEADAGEISGIELLKDEPAGVPLDLPADNEPLKLASEQEQQKQFDEAHRGPIPKIRCPKCGELNPPEAGVCLICSNELPTGTGAGKRRGSSNIKRDLAVGAISVMITAAAIAFAFFSIVPGLKNLKPAEGPRADEAKKAAQLFIDDLKTGKTAGVKKLLTSPLQTSVTAEQLDSFAKFINKGKIADVNLNLTRYEPNPQGDSYYLAYNILYEDKSSRALVISLREANNELKIDGAAASDLAGASVEIGERNFHELTKIIFIPAVTGFMGAIFKSCCAIVVVSVILSAMVVVSMWVVFNKAGQPGWAAIIPFYNMWVLAEVGEKPGWLGLASCLAGFIPYVGLFIGWGLSIFICIGVAKAFERGILFGLGLAFLPLIFYPVLAFGGD